MNTNPLATKVLCFGDSNTWGYQPLSEMRYPVDVRWTGLLQSLLGDDYSVIEEGLNGRTTNIDDPDFPGRNGLMYFFPCIKTHNPIDIIILMLGTNDTKHQFHRTPQEIAMGINDLLYEISIFARDWNQDYPQVLLLAPPLVDESVEGAREKFAGAAEKSAQLPKLYQRLAEQNDALFLDVSQWVKPSRKDGIHLEPADHRTIAEHLAKEILNPNIFFG